MQRAVAAAPAGSSSTGRAAAQTGHNSDTAQLRQRQQRTDMASFRALPVEQTRPEPTQTDRQQHRQSSTHSEHHAQQFQHTGGGLSSSPIGRIRDWSDQGSLQPVRVAKCLLDRPLIRHLFSLRTICAMRGWTTRLWSARQMCVCSLSRAHFH